MSQEFDGKSPYKIVKVSPAQLQPLEEVISGRELLRLDEAKAEGKQALEVHKKDTPMFIGGVSIPSKTNVYYWGQTQHGKTSTMKVTLCEVLERINEGSKEKVVVYAPSSELIPFIYAHASNAPVYILNPSDARCYQWDLNKDIKSTANTLDLTQTLVKEKQGDTPFFSEGAKSLLGAVINAFFLSVVKDGKSIDWTFADIVNAVRTEERIKAVLGLQPKYLNYIAENFLDRQNKDVLASLTARTQELQSVAPLWEGRPKFSLREFLDPTTQGGILILGEDADNRATVLEINRLLIERMGKMLSNREECKEARYWFFLDEFQQLGKMETLKRLVKDGLKRGIRIHLASQNTADIIATYGKDDANVLFWECGTHLIFYHGHEDSAQEAVKAIGKQKKRRFLRSMNLSVTKQSGTNSGENENTSHGQTFGKEETRSVQESKGTQQGENQSVSATVAVGKNETIVYEYAVGAEELNKLYEGEFYAVTSYIKGFWKHRYNWDALLPIVEARSDKPEHAREIERTEQERASLLEDWTSKDYDRLGLSKNVQKPKEPPTQISNANNQSYLQRLKEDFRQ